MINLRNVYGDKIFNRKASYRKSWYFPFISSLLLDSILTLIIIRVFQVYWEYAFIKVYGLLLLFGLLKFIFTSIIEGLNYSFTIRDSLAAEMKHYLSVFNHNVNWNEVGNYDDFLLEAAFNKTLSADLRVLAGINYGTVVDTMGMSPSFESRSYRLFNQLAPDYLEKTSEQINPTDRAQAPGS